MRLRSPPLRTMVAMGGPVRSRICERHSLRSRSGARYSVRVSVKPPVTCRVTIFTPFTDGPGEVKVERTIANSIVSGIFIFPLVWAPSGCGEILYCQSPLPRTIKMCEGDYFPNCCLEKQLY